MSPGVGGHRGPCPQCRSIPQRTSGEGCLLKPKRTNPCAYTPPSLKGTGWRRLNGETEARGLCAVGWGHPGRLDPTSLLVPCGPVGKPQCSQCPESGS